jgi:hypothetical protein
MSKISPLVGSFEYSNEPSGSIKGDEFRPTERLPSSQRHHCVDLVILFKRKQAFLMCHNIYQE